jgi:hypothetical protein
MLEEAFLNLWVRGLESQSAVNAFIRQWLNYPKFRKAERDACKEYARNRFA